MELRTVKLSLIDPWPKNPRGITIRGMERLTRQISRHDLYKPLIVKPVGHRFIVLGGNMRLRDLKKRGVRETLVSVVHPKSEAEDLAYAMSDNDRIGRYEREELARLILPIRDNLPLEDYEVTLVEETPFPDLMREFGPGMEISDKDLDESIPTAHKCQECGYKW